MIKSFITAAVAAATIGVAAITTPTIAEANGVGAGVAAGVTSGANVGSAIASRDPYYEPGAHPVYGNYHVRCHRVLFRDDLGREYRRRVCS